jgi:uncharacterized protein (TIGR03083 family)
VPPDPAPGGSPATPPGRSPDDLIADFSLVWSSLSELGSSLPAADWDKPTDCPGWNVRDQYAHMIGTESVLLGLPAPAPVAAAHALNPMGEANEGWVAGWRGQPGPVVLAAFRDVTERRLAALRAMAAADWEAQTATPVGPGPYRLFMEIRVFDCWVHEQDVRRAVGRPGHLSGPVAELAMGRLTGALGFVVGKRVGAADGVAVVASLAPPLAQTLAVAVSGGRAVPVDPPAAPTVRIRSDGETWACLCAGRWGAAEVVAAGRVEFDGDAPLGRQVIEQLTVTP